MRVVIHEALRGVVRAGVLRMNDLRTPADGKDAIWAALCAEAEHVRLRCAGRSVGEVAGVEDARRLYSAIGIDPTKTRPSSEALLRRALKGKDLYRIDPLVDLFNLASLRSLLPVGLYDTAKIAGGAVEICIGEPGWGFDGIRKDRVNVGGRLCLVDAAGPFGSPTSDSLRTAIGDGVKNALAVFFQHAPSPPARLSFALETAAELLAEHFRPGSLEQEVLGA